MLLLYYTMAKTLHSISGIKETTLLLHEMTLLGFTKLSDSQPLLLLSRLVAFPHLVAQFFHLKTELFLTRVNIASPIASSMLSLASIATEPGEAWWGVVRSGEEW